MKQDNVVDIAQAVEFDEIIDVRSGGEYALDRVPGAHNFPVLDDVERARVGTLYKQVSPFDARKLGAVLVARNIARHIEESFVSRPRTWRPLVYCWRGGQRSGAMAHVLRDVGWRPATLAGGYQSFRREVLAQLEILPGRFTFQVICGSTGSGKSRFLQALAAQGAQVLDLEQLARHRGSVLGALPGEVQPGQKWFESQVWNTLRKFDAERLVWIESESRKIGNIQVPTRLLEQMRSSRCIRIEPPIGERVRFLIEEYAHMLSEPAVLKGRLNQLSSLQSREVLDRWMSWIDARAWEMLVRDLLENHYDPLYQRSMAKSYPTLDASPVLNPQILAPAAITEYVRELLAGAQPTAIADS